MKSVLFVAVMAFAVASVMSADAEGPLETDLNVLSKEELIAKVNADRREHADTKAELDAAHEKISSLQEKLELAQGIENFDEKDREAAERKTKDQEKKAEAAKRAKKMQKKTKLSDLLMAHGAEFLAMKKAKEYKDSGSQKQKKEVMKAAVAGARAGAVGPLKKVARDAAVRHVKASRKAALAKGLKKKDAIRKITTQAATDAVKKLLEEQDKMVQKTAKEWTAKAIKKYPASLTLASDDDAPNVFTAPPTMHLSLDGAAPPPSEVTQLKEDVKTSPAPAKKAAKTIKISLSDDDDDEAKKPANTKVAAVKVAKAAAAAKQAAGKVVPESK